MVPHLFSETFQFSIRFLPAALDSCSNPHRLNRLSPRRAAATCANSITTAPMQASPIEVDADLEQLFQICKNVPASQMQLDTALRITRAFFASAPACKQWEGAVHNMSQCLACVAQALSCAECQWTSEFLNFVSSNISKANVLTLLQSISNIVSEAMVAVLYFFMAICSSSAGPEWSILFTGSQSLSQSLALVAQLLQVTSSLLSPHTPV